MEKEFLYVGHYIDINGDYILKIGTTNDLDRRRKEHTRNYKRSPNYKMAKMKDQFVSGAQQGNIEFTLEDGRVMKFHRLRKVNVKEKAEPVTIEEAYKNGWDVIL